VKKSRGNIKSTGIIELEKIHELIRGKIPKDFDCKKEIEAVRLERLINKLN
jgi:hypothetical protein